MNKILKRIISFILILSFVIPQCNIVTTKADNNPLESSFLKILKEGPTNTIPVLEYTDTISDKVFFAWDMDKMNGSSFLQGNFELEYKLEKNTRAKLKVEKDGTIANVTYRVEKWDETDQEWREIEPVSPSNAQNPWGYSVHTNIGALGQPKYIDARKFIDTYLNSAKPEYQVIDTQKEDDTEFLEPTFRITEDTGFSFQYYNRTMHFRWNSKDNKFYFVTNGVKKGIIYDFVLKYSTTGTGIENETSRKIITGISSDTFRAIPLANSGNTVNQKLDIDTDLITDPSVSVRDLDLTKSPSQGGDDNPGTDEVEMILRFDIPKEWDESTHSFSKIPDDYEMPAIITIGNKIVSSEISREIQLRLNNILSTNLTDDDMTIAGPATNNGVENVTGKDRISIRLGNLTPGEIYNPVTVSILENPSYLANKTILDFGEVFTFVKYEIVSESDKFYALVYPYRGYEGTYMLKSGNPLETSVIQKSDGVTPILLPLTVNSLNGQTQNYQIFFSPVKAFDNNEAKDSLYSQKIVFKATESMTGIGIPTNFDVINDYKLIPLEGVLSGDVANLDLTTQWDIGDTKVISKMVENAPNGVLKITYDLFNSLTATATNSKNFATVTMEIYKEDDKLYVKYSDENGKVLNTEPEILKIRSDNEAGRTSYIARVHLLANAAHKNAELSDPKDRDFFYPNIYFLNVKPKLVNGVVVAIGASLYDSITLNDISKLEVAPPQNLEAKDAVTKTEALSDDIDEVSFKARWDISGSKIKEYIDNSYPYPKDKIDIKVNLYISQDETYLREKFSKFDYADRLLNSIKVPYLEEYDETLYFSDINSETSMAVDGFSDPRAALRKNKVVRIAGIDITGAQKDNMVTSGESLSLEYKLDGMDKNQKYYMYADIVVTHKNTDDVIKIEKASKLSNLVYILTKGDKEVIGGNEKIPPAPILNKENIGLGEATLFWNKIYSYNQKGDKEKIEYEIIRINGKQLENKYLESKEEFESFYDNRLPDAESAGFITDGLNLMEYNGTNFNLADTKTYVYDPTNEIIKFTDKSLSPNQLYFYYVRTVRIIDDMRIVSSWSNITLTTTPIKNPINLKILRDDKSYDKKTEFFIEFDAPLQDTSKLGTEFDLEYSIKEDGKDWEEPETMNVSELKSGYTKSEVEGYSHFYYKIKELKSGTSYTIRVRMVDKNGDASLYSNAVITRTEVDQEDYNNNEKVKDIIEHLKQQLEEMLKQYYWTTIDTSKTFEIVYRSTMFNDFVSSATDGTLKLPSSDANELIYYFPASSLALLNEADKGFKIEHGDMQIILSKDAIKAESNEAIKLIAQDIKDKLVLDYYLKVSVNFKNVASEVEGNEPISKQVDVQFEIIGSDKDNKEWDSEVFNLLLAEIAKEIKTEKLNDLIKDDVKDGVTNEEMAKLLNDLILKAKNSISKEVKSKLDYVLYLDYLVEKLEAPLIVLFKTTDKTLKISGYQKTEDVWVLKSLTDLLGGKAIYSLVNGIFVFTASRIIISGMANVDGGEDIKNIVGKYGLGDFFGNNSFDINSNITKNMLLGSIARMLGATKGVDSVQYLSDKGLNVNNRNLYGYISTQDAISLLMSFYEKKTNTKISSIKIKDYNTISKIKGIDEKNKLSIQVAFETGLYKNKNMSPNERISIKDVLEILVALDKAN